MFTSSTVIPYKARLHRLYMGRVFILCQVVLVCSMMTFTDGQDVYSLKAPINYTVLTGPISVHYTIPANITLEEGIIEVVLLKDESIIMNAPFPVMVHEAEISIFCGTVDKAGQYVFRMREKSDKPILVESQVMNAFWPRATITLPRNHTALTSEVTMYVHVEEVACESEHPDSMYNIEVVYYGEKEVLVGGRPEPKQYIFREDIKRLSYLKTNVPKVLSCNLMDQGGIYRGRLVSVYDDEYPVALSDVMNVQWSDKYSLTAVRKSIFPCERNFPVQYSQPECSGRNDKIRLYEQRQTDSSMASPVELIYLAEKRAGKSSNVAAFPCSKFDISAYGYCFKYVSTAMSGAVHEQKAICVPTQNVPVRNTVVNGDWGEWASWSTCTVSCGLGKQNRYRVCDNPPPSKGGMFCQGESIEYRHCEISCTASTAPPYSRTPDPACQCGCEVFTPPGGYIVSSLRCPGSSVWIIRTKPGYWIELSFEMFTLKPMNKGTWIKVRNGDTYMSDLLLHSFGGKKPNPVQTTGSSMLIELFSPYELKAYSHDERFIAFYKAYVSNETALLVPGPESGTSVWESTVTIIGIVFCAVIIICTIAFVCHNRRIKKRKQQKKAQAHQALLSNGEVANSPTHSVHSMQGSANVTFSDAGGSPSKRQYVMTKGVCTHPQAKGVREVHEEPTTSRRSSHSRKGSASTPGSMYQGSIPSPYGAKEEDYIHDPHIFQISPAPLGESQHRNYSKHSEPTSPTRGKLSSHGSKSPTKSVSSSSHSHNPASGAPLADLEDLSPTTHTSPVHRVHPKSKMAPISENIPMECYADNRKRSRGGLAETAIEKRPPVEGRDSLTRKKRPADKINKTAKTDAATNDDAENGNIPTDTRPQIKPLPLRGIQPPDGQSPENKPLDPNANTPMSVISDMSPFNKSKLFPDQSSRTPSEIVFMDQDFEYDDYVPDLPGSYFTMDPHAYTLTWSKQPPWSQQQLLSGSASQQGSKNSVGVHGDGGGRDDKGSSHC